MARGGRPACLEPALFGLGEGGGPEGVLTRQPARLEGGLERAEGREAWAVALALGLSLPFNPSRCSEDRLRPFVRSTGLGSERTPRVDPRVPCGVSVARRKKTEANRADRPTGAFRVADNPPQAGRSYAAWRV